MNENRSFKAMYAAVALSVLLSVILLVFSCGFPRRLVGSMYEHDRPFIESAKKAAADGDFETVLSDMTEIVSSLENKKHLLMLFYDHNGVSDLTGEAKTALQIAQTGEASQFLETIGEMETVYEYLLHINDVSFSNII